MTTSSKATNDSHCSLLYLNARNSYILSGYYSGFIKVTILDT